MNIVLHEPEIPLNTGNIGRTCVAANTKLHLIKPLGFKTDDRSIKRSGLDYWHMLDVSYYDSYEDFIDKISLQNVSAMIENELITGQFINANKPQVFYATTKAKKSYTDVKFGANDYIMFGKESAGLPAYIREANNENCIRIPMFQSYRSLNLSNSVAVVLYEALRQNGFYGLD